MSGAAPPPLPLLTSGGNPGGMPLVLQQSAGVQIEQCLRLGPVDTPELGPHVAFKHQPSGTLLIEKTNRFDTKFDADQFLQLYKLRQSVRHKGLVKLVDFKINEELKVPMPEYVVRGYYEFLRKNLRAIKEDRKNSKVKFREREIFQILYDLVDVLAFMESQGFSHSDLRPTLILVDSPSDYNFPLNSSFLVCDSLNQFESWEDKQRFYINNELDLYLPPDVYEALARGFDFIDHDKFKTDVFALGLMILEIAIEPDLQKIYDRPLKSFRRERLDTAITLFLEKLDPNNILRKLIYGMLDFNEDSRFTFEELLKHLADRESTITYYYKQEGRQDKRVFSNPAEEGLDPYTAKYIMSNSLVQSFGASKFQKNIDPIEDVPTADLNMHSRSNYGTFISRRTTTEDGFEQHVAINNKKNDDIGVPTLNTVNRPVRTKFMGKHEWFQRDHDTQKLIYTDYVAPVHSVNRIIRGQHDPNQGEEKVVVQPDGTVIVLPAGTTTPQEKAEKSKKRMAEVLSQFNQPEIRKGLADDFENNLKTLRNDSDNNLSGTMQLPTQLEILPSPTPGISKYYRDYYTLPPKNKPVFNQLNVNPFGQTVKTPLDPDNAMKIDKYSYVSGVYALGAEDDSQDLIDLHHQLTRK